MSITCFFFLLDISVRISEQFTKYHLVIMVAAATHMSLYHKSSPAFNSHCNPGRWKLFLPESEVWNSKFPKAVRVLSKGTG